VTGLLLVRADGEQRAGYASPVHRSSAAVTGGLPLLARDAELAQIEALSAAARASMLEREYPLGVAQHCLAFVIRREPDRDRLLRGPARLARPGAGGQYAPGR